MKTAAFMIVAHILSGSTLFPPYAAETGTAIQNIAIITLKNGDGVSAADAELITDRLNAELFRTGKVTMMEREQINAVLKEQGFQRSGACTDAECLVEMGQVLGVRFIATGSIGLLGKMYMVNLRLIDVRSGQIERVVSKDVKGGIEDVVLHLRGIARMLIGLDPGPEPSTPGTAASTTQTPAAAKPSANTALLSVKSHPAGASVIINGAASGTTPYHNPSLVPGEYKVRVEKPRYDSYEETVTLGKGGVREITAQLAYQYSLLSVFSTPEGASVFLDKKKAGVTPFYIDTLPPGNYSLRLELDGYNPVTQSISAVRGAADTLSFTLFTRAQLDSARKAQHALGKGRRNARRIVFGLLAAAAWSTGIVMNTRAQESLDREERLYALYNRRQTQSEYDRYWADYRSAADETDRYVLMRNILYGAGGGFTFFMGLSIPF